MVHLFFRKQITPDREHLPSSFPSTVHFLFFSCVLILLVFLARAQILLHTRDGASGGPVVSKRGEVSFTNACT